MNDRRFILILRVLVAFVIALLLIIFVLVPYILDTYSSDDNIQIISGILSASASISMSVSASTSVSPSVSISESPESVEFIPKILVFGDSYTDTDFLPGGDINWTDYLLQKLNSRSTLKKVAKYANSPQMILTYMYLYGYSTSLDINIAIIFLGTNNALQGTYSYFLEPYQSIIYTLLHDYPDIHVYLMTIPNIKQVVRWQTRTTVTNDNLFISDVTKINNDIRGLASDKRISIIDVNAYVTNTSMYETDGIHLTTFGDNTISKLVESIIS
jgi:hypothetical protein